jgi:uncharacterized protein YjbI with pentapeptide repeats
VIGSRDDRLFSFFNSFVYLVCLYVAPIATLLFLILRTLPLHNNHLTTFQSVILFVDIWLSLFVVRKPRAWLSTAIAAFSALFAALLLSVPDGPQDRFGRRYLVSAPVPFGMPNATRRAFWPTAFLLESEVDLATSHPVRWFSRNLVVVNAHIGPSENDTRVVSIQDGSHPNGRPSIPIELRPNLGARNLRYAILDYTNLRGANLIAADLTGASLRYAGLADALLGCTARGVGANDRITKAAKANCTKFDGANLEGVQLVRAVDLTTFDGELSHSASFADANLSLANLQDADVPFLILDRADLSDAMLLGANLSYASLIGANLSGANLAGATMRTVNAAFAVFVGASLIGADLKTSYFEIANFDSADLAGANFEDARMWGANFRNAHLWASNPPDKESVSWVDFTNAHSERPSESDIQAFEQILNWLRSDSRFTGTMTFTELFKHTKDTEEPEANSEGVWKSWITSLAVSNADIAYRLALSRLITEVGCRDGQSARALERWSIIPAQAEVNRGPTQEEAAPEVDHRLDKLPDRESSPYEWGYSSYDVPVSPIPAWYDLNGFLDALSNPTTCKAAGAVSPELVISIKNQATMRKAQSASR